MASFKAKGGSMFSGDVGKTSMVVLILAAVAVIILIVFYIIYLLKTHNMKSMSLLNETKSLGELTKVTGKIPDVFNMAEYSYSMWLYITDVPTSQQPLKVLTRGGAGGSGSGSVKENPIMFLEGNTNRLYVSIATSASAAGPTPSLISICPSSPNYQTSGYITVQVEYLPIQRWVHVAAVVNQDVLSVFVNGDIYSVKSVMDGQTTSTGARPTFGRTAGDVTIGGAGNKTGYISSVLFYNYSISQKDVAAIYNRGPTPWAWAAWLGIGRYRFQSPIVKVADDPAA